VTHFESNAKTGERVAIASEPLKLARTSADPFIIYCDTREQMPPPFPDGVTLERVTMAEADYTTHLLQGIAAIERKSLSDFANSITRDRERFDDELRRLVPYRFKCICVEGDLGTLYRESAVHPHSVIGSIASFYARRDCPTLFVLNAAGAGRLIAGLLRRWEERLTAEREGAA
jgi:ERCC4-type nuclease